VQEVALAAEIFSSNLVAVLLAGGATTPQVLALDLADVEAKPVDVLATVDPPVHTRQRRVIGRAFQARRMAVLESAVRARAAALIDRAVETGGCDWMGAVAGPLPLAVIIDLLGLPAGDASTLARWSDAAIATLSGAITAEQWAESLREIGAFQRYLRARFREAEHSPREDLMGELVRATRDRGDGLSREEAKAALFQLFIAGNESTTSLLGSAVRLMVERPDVEACVRSDPARIGDLLDEALRLESPFQGHFRVVRADTRLGGVELTRGSRVMVLWGAANRDEAVFPNPDHLDLERPNIKSHVAFGLGIHYCLGAALARLEARVVLEELLARCRRIRLAPGHCPSHLASVFVRRLRSLELVVAPC
jgi:cytochrome P450